MESKPACFPPAYDRLLNRLANSPWFEQAMQLRAQPRRYEFLDAAQLVKHACGLLARYKAQPAVLLYLYWEPVNAGDWPACARHRAVASDLAARASACSVRLTPLSYPELWSAWDTPRAPHVDYLRRRYLQRV